MKAKLVSFFIPFLLITICCQSQDVPLGGWKDYLSYQKGLTVCQGGGKVYCCSSSGVFSYNQSDNSIERYNKVTGLSDIGCTVARYNTATNILVIGYTDGNIDLVTSNQIINIPDLKNSSVQGSKTINNIYFSGNLAYISCGQGILVIDLTQDIILSFCKIGALGSPLNVFSTTISNTDTIFAATTNGIYKISLYDPDIQNYQDWQVVSKPLPAGTYNGIVSCGTKIYASFSSGFYEKDSVFIYNSGKWSRDTNIVGNNVRSLECSIVNNTPYLIYCGNSDITVFDSTHEVKIFNYVLPNSPNPFDAILDNNMNLWIADANYGLVKSSLIYPNYAVQNYYPPGPFSNSIFAMAAEGSSIYMVPGGYDQSEVPAYNAYSYTGVSAYSDGSWIYVPPVNKTIIDLCCVAIDPSNPLHACAGSWGGGLVEYSNNVTANIYTPGNSSLLYGYNAGTTLRIGGVGFDTSGNLWATNSIVTDQYLSVKKPNGIWQGIHFAGIPLVPYDAIVTKLLVTQGGAKWALFPGQGILAYQDYGTFATPTSSNSVFITDAAGNGALPSLNIYCMTQDLNGAIWIGTDVQVVVFYSPDNVFNGSGGWDAQKVYVQQTGYTQYLMQDQFTSCIAVDGANRKWIGTLGGGAFLMSADGTQQILNFTSSNSPLPSNNIISITINQSNGEVFFGTDQGLVSYRGTATEGNSAFNNVYAYPDPVPHGYSGPIAIKNLVSNSDVKIASISGEVVYHTTALGGQAVWYGTNFNGVRVQTGVYLVFCTSPDGTQSLVTKLLLVN